MITHYPSSPLKKNTKFIEKENSVYVFMKFDLIWI